MGFDFSPNTLNSLLDDSVARSGLLESGFLLTASERTQYDARIALGESLKDALIRADGDDGFGGARLEHYSNGVFHVYHTSDSEGLAIKEDFLSSVLSGARVQFHSVTNSMRELIEARNAVWDIFDVSEKGAGGLHAAGIDMESNKLVVELDSNISEAERVSDDSLASRIHSAVSGVSINVIYTEPSKDSVCYFPDDCVDPMMAGIEIARGSPDELYCSLGFMVEDGSDTQALTAGHCGWSGSTDWYHDGYGSSSFGSEIDDDAYFDIGRDGMLIQIPESQGSNDVALCPDWGCIQITGHLQNSELYGGMPVSMLGKTSGLKSGTIKDTEYTWWGEACNCQQYGFKVSYTSVGGDSGAPVWRGSNAVGLQATASSAVPVEYLLIYYGVDIRTS